MAGSSYPTAVVPGATAVGYELPAIHALLDRGVALVVTDYVGLGVPGREASYVDRVDMGHAVLDAARAAQGVAGASITEESRFGVFGYSQGGGAAASAAELAPSYAPDLPLVAGYAGAPPADLRSVLATVDGTIQTSVVAYVALGLSVNHPSFARAVDRVTDPAGKAALARAASGCTADGLAAFAYRRSREWTTDGTPLGAALAADPAAQAVLEDARLGRRAPAAAMRIVSGTRDDIVGHAQARDLAVDWCARGAQVTYAPAVQVFPSFGTAANHVLPSLFTLGASVDWMVDRLAGVPSTSGCARLPGQP